MEILERQTLGFASAAGTPSAWTFEFSHRGPYMNSHRRIGLFTALLLLGACGGSAGSAAINIAGKVVDNGLRPLAGAVVTVGSQNAVSDLNGQFTISNITPPYDLTAIAMSPTKVGVLY